MSTKHLWLQGTHHRFNKHFPGCFFLSDGWPLQLRDLCGIEPRINWAKKKNMKYWLLHDGSLFHGLWHNPHITVWHNHEQPGAFFRSSIGGWTDWLRVAAALSVAWSIFFWLCHYSTSYYKDHEIWRQPKQNAHVQSGKSLKNTTLCIKFFHVHEKRVPINDPCTCFIWNIIELTRGCAIKTSYDISDILAAPTVPYQKISAWKKSHPFFSTQRPYSKHDILGEKRSLKEHLTTNIYHS